MGLLRWVVPEVTFKAYVDIMRQNYEEASRNKEEIGILINENEKLPRCSWRQIHDSAEFNRRINSLHCGYL